MLAFAVTSPHVSGILNGVSPEIITNSEYTAALASAMHRPAVLPVPGWVLQAAFGRDRAAMLLEGARVAPERALALGYTFEFPHIRDALADLVRQ